MFGREGIESLLEAAERRKRVKGSALFREGDTATGLFVLLKGSLKLMRISSDGREMVLHLAKPPALVAEAAIFIGKYPATAMVTEDCEVGFLDRAAALDLMEKNGRFARFLLEGVSLWVSRLVNRIEELTTNDATSRLARYLLELLEREVPRMSPSAPRVKLPVKKGELAQMLNLQLPSLSRIFRHLQDKGIIEVRGGEIVLHDPAALRRLTVPSLG